jgi:hypothetical protein
LSVHEAAQVGGVIKSISGGLYDGFYDRVKGVRPPATMHGLGGWANSLRAAPVMIIPKICSCGGFIVFYRLAHFVVSFDTKKYANNVTSKNGSRDTRSPLSQTKKAVRVWTA